MHRLWKLHCCGPCYVLSSEHHEPVHSLWRHLHTNVHLIWNINHPSHFMCVQTIWSLSRRTASSLMQPVLKATNHYLFLLSDFYPCFLSRQSALGMIQMLEDTLIEHAHTKPLLPSQLTRYREVQVPDGRSYTPPLPTPSPHSVTHRPSRAEHSLHHCSPVMAVSMATTQRVPCQAPLCLFISTWLSLTLLISSQET